MSVTSSGGVVGACAATCMHASRRPAAGTDETAGSVAARRMRAAPPTHREGRGRHERRRRGRGTRGDERVAEQQRACVGGRAAEGTAAWTNRPRSRKTPRTKSTIAAEKQQQHNTRHDNTSEHHGTIARVAARSWPRHHRHLKAPRRAGRQRCLRCGVCVWKFGSVLDVSDRRSRTVRVQLGLLWCPPP